MAQAQVPSIFTDIGNFIQSIPPVTRYLFIGTLSLSVGSMVGLCSIRQLILFYEPVVKKFEVQWI